MIPAPRRYPQGETMRARTDYGRRLFFCILLPAAIVRTIAAVYSSGYMHPDEPYQSLEQAHRIVYGYGIIPWEFVFGARFWFFPALYVPLIWLLGHTGLGDPLHAVIVVRFFNALCSLLLIYSAYRAGEELKDRQTGLIAAILCAFWYLCVYYSVRTLSDTFVMNIILFPFLLIGGKGKRGRQGRFLGGLLLGVAFLIRFPVAIFFLPLSAHLFMERDSRGFLAMAGGFSLCLFIQGMLDYLLWGSSLHSLTAYYAFHSTGLPAALWGSEPWYFYLAWLWNEFYPLSPLVALLFLYGLHELPLIGGSAVLFIGFLSALLHKEVRFPAPAIPLIFLSIAGGLTALSARIGPLRLRRAFIIGSVSAVIVLSCARSVRFSWRQNSEYASALAYLSGRSDVRAVTVLGAYWWEIGGYFYLHHDVPLEAFGTPEEYMRFAPGVRLPGTSVENSIRTARTPEQLMGSPGHLYHLSLQPGEEPNYLIIAQRLLTPSVRARVRDLGFGKVRLQKNSVIYTRP